MFEHPLRVAFGDPEILREDPRGSASSFRQSVPCTRVKTCVGQDSNLGTPSGRDLESLAFDQAWLPTRRPRRGRATLNLSRAGSTAARARRFFGGAFFRLEGTVHGPVLHEVLL